MGIAMWMGPIKGPISKRTRKGFSRRDICRKEWRGYTQDRIFNNEKPSYENMIERLKKFQKENPGRKLTYSEKVIYSHLAREGYKGEIVRGKSDLKLVPDRVAMQDASAQTALLQFMVANRKGIAVPTSVHCDHLIQAQDGNEADLKRSIEQNKEVLDFIEQCSRKYGIEMWYPGSGIIHQVVLENYAVPGTIILGTDSHTPNAGGLGTIAIGVGGADAVDAVCGIDWELKAPVVIGIWLEGELNGWASPKDVILKIVGELGVEGATNHIVEYFGPGVESLSCTGMATICNMGAEMGATTSVFPYTNAMGDYLEFTQRRGIRKMAEDAKRKGYLTADEGCDYDKVIEINLSKIEPRMNGPFSPDISTPLTETKKLIEKNGWEDKIDATLIGSCTNSSYEDICRSSNIVSQAAARNLKLKTPLLVALGSDRIHSTVEKNELKKVFVNSNALILANACGPCIGQWKRKDFQTDKPNTILTSFNRNFKARNDGLSQTRNFLCSPEIVTAMSYSGKLSFNPITDTLVDGDGKPFKFEPPPKVALPKSGFAEGNHNLRSHTGGKPDSTIDIKINPSSTRLQLIEPFPEWDYTEFTDMRILLKIKGKCTTDHISAAGKWLKYKGHLENISKNTLIGAFNSFTQEVNTAINELTHTTDTIPNVAEQYKKNNVRWMVVGDTNYGEGSAREHAALQQRFLGCCLVLVKSFARIHEINLKKQGIIPVTFNDVNDYDKLEPYSIVRTIGITKLAESPTFELEITPPNKTPFIIKVNHTMSPSQISWFKAGSSLNLLAKS